MVTILCIMKEINNTSLKGFEMNDFDFLLDEIPVPVYQPTAEDLAEYAEWLDANEELPEPDEMQEWFDFDPDC